MLDARAVLLILAAGCYAQAQPTLYTLNPPEQCALSAMMLASENGGIYGAGESGGIYGAGENGGLYGAATRSNDQPQCRPAASPSDQCWIRAMQTSARLKHQSNAGEVAPVSNDQIEYVRSSTYQSCMAGAVGGPPGTIPPR